MQYRIRDGGGREGDGVGDAERAEDVLAQEGGQWPTAGHLEDLAEDHHVGVRVAPVFPGRKDTGREKAMARSSGVVNS